MMRPTLITGGAGFIGTNLADHLLSTGGTVVVLDDLSRAGVEHNLSYLDRKHPGRLKVEVADISRRDVLARWLPQVDAVYHFAAQTAVTTSLRNPERDFTVNARGTFGLLEALRGCLQPPFLVYTSTNKVYGGLSDVALSPVSGRYLPSDPRLREAGISERQRLDFQTPYGCSKGTADQYVRDYAHSFALPACVFRMSCIYGRHQCGTEDQGWVAHFARQALGGDPIRLYGDGQQVRDLLYVDDLISALVLARQYAATTSGRAFNIGGGTHNAVSVLEVIGQLEALIGRCELTSHPWRTGDQRYYASDISEFRAATGWRPQTDVPTGLAAMVQWLRTRRPDEPSATAGPALQPTRGSTTATSEAR